ncbi:5'-nucleotidase domain-containing protein [Tritrichomonas foetus]|uniref:5'-nucleotidase domain-containing protein n=1 Tax=Tritrichomonas foetus TaxID=1144522 RepID=A0A1J4KB10_9EUKA|nr:5'-nucleotidase domain-containing protein [Tritrichomonas foetus]|eukprot:OHT08146.1 5'-nucleotidase domain-containing protein [Tritrichomonas foetus]
MLFALLVIRLSDFCSDTSSGQTTVHIDNFDIPFSKCQKKNFAGIKIITNYSTIQKYQHRTLRISNGLHLEVENVTSGDILQKIDVFDATLELKLYDNVDFIDGSLRVNHEDNSQLIIRNGSLRVVPQKLIRIIHTNDVHCAIKENPKENVIGLSKLVSFVKNEKKLGAQNRYSVFLVDSGDYIQGQPICGLSNGTIGTKAMKLADYDAMTLGNHEFDYGHDGVYNHVNLINQNGTKLVTANILDSSNTNKLDLKPYLIKEADGIKIGFLGLITPTTNETSNPKTIGNVTFDDKVVSISQKYVNILRQEEKCDIVVLLTHLGYDTTDVGSDDIASQFDGIDVIIDGHSHTELANGATRQFNDHTTLIAQTGWSLKKVGVVDIMVDSLSNQAIGTRAKLLSYDDLKNYSDDLEAKEFIDTVSAEFDKITSVVVGYSNIELDCDRALIRSKGISKMGDLVTTAMLRTAKDAQVAFINGGGVRTRVNVGEITWGELVAVLPFGNPIVVINMTGSNIKELLRFGTRFFGEQQTGGFPVSSGITYQINLDLPPTDENRITNVKIVDSNGSNPVDLVDSQYYGVAINDFMRDGGDGYTFLGDKPKVSQYGPILDALVDYIKNLPNATVTGDEALFKYERIKVIKSEKKVNLKSENLKQKFIRKTELEETVQVPDGALDMSYFRYNTKVDVFKPFFNYTINAHTISIKNIELARKLIPSDKGIIGSGYLYILSDPSNFETNENFRNELTNFHSVKCESFFHKPSNGKCVPNVSLIIIFAVMIITAAGFLVLLLLQVNNCQNKVRGYEETSELNDPMASET